MQHWVSHRTPPPSLHSGLYSRGELRKVGGQRDGTKSCPWVGTLRPAGRSLQGRSQDRLAGCIATHNYFCLFVNGKIASRKIHTSRKQYKQVENNIYHPSQCGRSYP